MESNEVFMAVSNDALPRTCWKSDTSWSSVTRSTGSCFTCHEPRSNQSHYKTYGALVLSNSSMNQLLLYDVITLRANIVVVNQKVHHLIDNFECPGRYPSSELCWLIFLSDWTNTNCRWRTTSQKMINGLKNQKRIKGSFLTGSAPSAVGVPSNGNKLIDQHHSEDRYHPGYPKLSIHELIVGFVLMNLLIIYTNKPDKSIQWYCCWFFVCLLFFLFVFTICEA